MCAPLPLALAALFASQLTPLPDILHLDEAVRLARLNQPLVHQAQAATESGAGQEMQARAGLLPQLLGTATYQRTTANYVLRPGALPPSGAALKAPPSSASTYDYWNFNLGLNQLIYDFNQTPDKWLASSANTEALRRTADAALLLAVLNVRAAYFQASSNKGLVKVAEETLANQEKHREQIEGYIAVGTRAEIDLAQARTDVANAKVQLITAQNNYATAKVTLNQAIGIEARIDYEVAADVMAPVPHEDDGDSEALVEEAVRARPEMTSLMAQVHAQELAVAGLRGGYFPSLGLQGQVSDGGVKLDDLRWNFYVGAALSWPLFQGGLTAGQVEQAEGLLRNLQAQLEMSRQQVRVDVEQARLALRAARETLVAAGEALDNAKLRLQYAEGRYKTGVGSIIELSDAQLAVSTAAAQKVTADFALSTARAKLVQALGLVL